MQLTHKPSGIVVVCQQERSQLGNRVIAMEMLRSKLYDIELQKKNGDIAAKRKTMVSTGDRFCLLFKSLNLFPLSRMQI